MLLTLLAYVKAIVSINHFSLADQNIFERSVDPDESTHNEPSHQDLHCLPFYLYF